MNVLKIVVDELPKCSECIFLNSEHNYHCILTLKNVAMPHVNPHWCPLVVDVPEVCEWKYQFFTPQDGEVYERKCSLGYATTEYKNQFVFCPNCGKRIKYIESE